MTTATEHSVQRVCEQVVADLGVWCPNVATVRVRATVSGIEPQIYRFCADHAEVGAQDLLSIYTRAEVLP